MNSFYISNFHLPRFFNLSPKIHSKLPFQAPQLFTSQEAWNTTHHFETLLYQGSQANLSKTELENQNFLTSVNQELQEKINTPEPEIQNRLNTLNSNRVREGKTPLNFSTTNQEIEKILNNPSLNNKEKKDQIENLRKQLGLSKKDMKKLFTKRLARLHQELAQKIQNRAQSLAQNLERLENTYGKESSQAIAARQRLSSVQQILKNETEKHQQISKLCKNLYPSFWGKIGGFFKKVGSVFKKIPQLLSKAIRFVTPFLNFVPGLGPLFSVAKTLFKGIQTGVRFISSCF